MHNYTHQQFDDALQELLFETDFKAVHLGQFDIREKCDLVARLKFRNKLKSEDEESLSIVLAVMNELCETGMHGLSYESSYIS